MSEKCPTTQVDRTWVMSREKASVPAIAAAKAKSVRDTSVEDGRKAKAKRMPSCADAIVAPVVGDTNLFAQSCCMMRPAMLRPAPASSTAASRGRREARNTSSKAGSPARSCEGVMSMAPVKSEAALRTASAAASSRVVLPG